MTTPAESVPIGSTVRLARRTKVRDRGRVLVGGVPTRVARLTHAARSGIVDGDLVVTDAVTSRLGTHLIESGLGNPAATTLPEVPLDGLTVVIPVYERAAALGRLLASLPHRVAGVIVVDDASPNGDAIAAVTREHGARLLRLDTNSGPAAARNAGLGIVTTTFVAFIDSDVEVEPGALELLLRHFADRRLAMAAPRVISTATPRSSWIARYEGARSSLDLGPDPALVRPRTPVAWVSSTCLVARVSELGPGFDASMRVGEDVDLVWRLVGEGRHVRFEPNAVVQHAPRETMRAWLGRKYFYGTGAHPLATRHPRDIAPAVLPGWGMAALALVSVQRPWAAWAAGGVVATALVSIARRVGHTAHPWRLSAELTSYGVLGMVGQGTALVLRHWWPAFAVAATASRRARRLVIAAAILDSTWEYLRLRPSLDPIRFAAARRLDDLAYGAGVWASVIRGRSIAALLPSLARTGSSRRAGVRSRRASTHESAG
ncbi:mycofactocin biosynthesis glycosyltransferase MftF [Agromyces tropicus]|uniref:Mycofactocin biosynthesis glycosyltransferase MftF n=1 Tax=Agromyces tropicus TaxID=555371 RepID=A0ABN2U2N7_9MICO